MNKFEKECSIVKWDVKGEFTIKVEYHDKTNVNDVVFRKI